MRKAKTGPMVIVETAYYTQRRGKYRAGWDSWACSSPHFRTCADARKVFASTHLWPNEELRLVRGVFTHKRVPGTRGVYFYADSTCKVLRKRTAA